MSDYELKDEELEAFREANGYLKIRRLPDGSVAILADLIFTRSIMLDVDKVTPFRTNRFCFENRAWADREFDLLESKDDEPEGWIARRPEVAE